MTELEKKIIQAVSDGGNLKSAEIAAIIDEEKKAVDYALNKSNFLDARLEQDNDFRWHLKYTNGEPDDLLNPNPGPKVDNDLHNICCYYLNCIALESSNSVSQPVHSDSFPKYVIARGIGKDIKHDDKVTAFLSKVYSDPNKVAYLGYPVRLYSDKYKGKNHRKLAPVFLLPITYNGGRIELSSVPSVNKDVLKAFSPNNDALVIELLKLEEELGLSNQIFDADLCELVLRLERIRQWDFQESIDPYITNVFPLNASLPDGIYNQAVVIEANRQPYTHGLESELLKLSKISEEEYSKTALYYWIKQTGSNAIEAEDLNPLLEVLPLNSEQAQAVDTALKSTLTVVTGPPGTGKSQVVTDLLFNIAWNGKLALFSSKNNKAVDVVEQRANSLSKRPVVLRTGSNQYAHRLAEIISATLSISPSQSDKEDAEYYLRLYKSKIAEAKEIEDKKHEIIKQRNQLDESEQKYCSVRNRIEPYYLSDTLFSDHRVGIAAKDFSEAFYAAQKEKQPIYKRLIWSLLSERRKAIQKTAEQHYNSYAQQYDLPIAYEAMTDEQVDQMVQKAIEFDDAVTLASNYKNALESFKGLIALEELDQQLSRIKKELSNIAGNLWNKWLLSQSISFSQRERFELQSFVSAIQLAGDVDLSDYPGIKQKFSNVSKLMEKHLPCWAITSLSAKSRIPFKAGLFDYVIIDEASQCDIASMIPLLYRAKRAVIIGDPKQLSHISEISEKQDLSLLEKYDVDTNWSYRNNSLYSIASSMVLPSQIIQLKDHFRSCSEIIDFSNKYFYGGSLRAATKYEELKTPKDCNPGIFWINAPGNTVRPESGSAYNTEEAERVVVALRRLITNKYKGTIGVTTPFVRQAERIKEILEKREPVLLSELYNKHAFIVDTVHKFQGDERDLVLFSPVVSNNTPDSSIRFLLSTGNLFNVAITRARAVLIVVGDLQYCLKSKVPYLEAFARYCSDLGSREDIPPKETTASVSKKYPPVDNPELVSEWEIKFYEEALFNAGIQTIPQYPVDKYILDFALFLEDGRKLDIEIDGEMYHRQWNGELCYRDQLRNQRLIELGWDVKRFWVYQIQDDTNWCIEQIKKWING